MRRWVASLVVCASFGGWLACGAPPAPIAPLPELDLDAGGRPPPDAASSAPVDAGAPPANLAPLACALGMKWESAGDQRGRFEPRALTPSEKSKLAELDRARAAPSSSDETREEAAYARARMFFEARMWADAGVAFRELALEHPGKTTAPYAAQLYLECLNVLASHGAPGCRDEMARDVPALIAVHCGATPTDAQTCATLRTIDAQLGRAQAQTLPHDQAGERYVALFKQHCQGAAPAEARCDELLYNAGVSFKAAGDTSRARDALALMKDPKNKVHKSPLAARLECMLSGDAGACH